MFRCRAKLGSLPFLLLPFFQRQTALLELPVGLVAGDETKFLLGSREIASGDIDVYSEKSPLGAAVLGAEIGATVSYTAPNGRQITVEIKSAEFFA